MKEGKVMIKDISNSFVSYDESNLNNILIFLGTSLINQKIVDFANLLISNNFEVFILGLSIMKNEKYKEYKINEKINCTLIDYSDNQLDSNDSEELHFKKVKEVSNVINKFLDNKEFNILYTNDFWGLDYGFKILKKQYLNKKIFWVHNIFNYFRNTSSLNRIDYFRTLEKMYINIPDLLLIENKEIAKNIFTEYDIQNYIIMNDSEDVNLEEELENTNLRKKYLKLVDNLNYFKKQGFINRGILHGIGPSAGQPYGLSKALRKFGKSSMSISIVKENKFRLLSDAVWDIDTLNCNLSLTYWIADRFEIIHLHFRPIMRLIENKKYIFPSFLDLSIFKQLNKTIIFNYRGSEIRKIGIFKKVNPFAWIDKDDPTYDVFDDESKNYLEKIVKSYADKVLVPDYELSTYISNAHVLPRIIDTDNNKYVGLVNQKKFKIIHAPSRRGVKGTQDVLKAINNLKNNNFEFDFELIENLEHDKMIEKIKEADIVIDQLIIGWYGVLSVEAMALGKVTLAYIREDLVNKIPNSAIVNVNINTLENTLAELLNNRDKCNKISKESRKFVEDYHSEMAVVKKLEEYYSVSKKYQLNKEIYNNMIEDLLEKRIIEKKLFLLEKSFCNKLKKYIINSLRKFLQSLKNKKG